MSQINRFDADFGFSRPQVARQSIFGHFLGLRPSIVSWNIQLHATSQEYINTHLPLIVSDAHKPSFVEHEIMFISITIDNESVRVRVCLKTIFCILCSAQHAPFIHRSPRRKPIKCKSKHKIKAGTSFLFETSSYLCARNK